MVWRMGYKWTQMVRICHFHAAPYQSARLIKIQLHTPVTYPTLTYRLSNKPFLYWELQCPSVQLSFRFICKPDIIFIIKLYRPFLNTEATQLFRIPSVWGVAETNSWMPTLYRTLHSVNLSFGSITSRCFRKWGYYGPEWAVEIEPNLSFPFVLANLNWLLEKQERADMITSSQKLLTL